MREQCILLCLVDHQRGGGHNRPFGRDSVEVFKAHPRIHPRELMHGAGDAQLGLRALAFHQIERDRVAGRDRQVPRQARGEEHRVRRWRHLAAIDVDDPLQLRALPEAGHGGAVGAMPRAQPRRSRGWFPPAARRAGA